MTWGTEGLTVRFGRRTALDAVSVTVEPGTIHAVIGGDGAGKSTLLRVLAGIGLDHSGTVRLPAQDRIGFVPSAGGVFPDLTVAEHMAFVASAHRMTGWRPRAADLLGRAGLDRFGDRLAGRLSGGERRKLAGSMAMLAEPSLLVLDEVTTGVDPVSRMELWRLVATAVAAGTAVVVATTYLDEAERATLVSLLHDGRLLVSGRPEDLVAHMPGRVTDTDSPTAAGRAWRRGRRWRQWQPDPAPPTAYRPTLEDAAIVYELRAGEATA